MQLSAILSLDEKVLQNVDTEHTGTVKEETL